MQNKLKFGIFIITIFSSLVYFLSNGTNTFYHETIISLKVSSAAPGVYQLFYDTGKGYNAVESIVKKHDSFQSEEIIFVVSRIKFNKFRIDPGQTNGIIKISSISISHDNQIIQFSDAELLQKFNPLNDINKFEVVNNDLEIVSTGIDPQFELNGKVSDSIKFKLNLNPLDSNSFIGLFSLFILTAVFLTVVYYFSVANEAISAFMLQSNISKKTSCALFAFLTPPALIAATLPVVCLISGDPFELLKNLQWFTFFATFQLLLALVYLFVVGFLITGFMPGNLWFNNPNKFYPIHCIAVSTFVLMIYVYLRSIINYLFDFIVPITAIDFLLILLSLYLLTYKKKANYSLRSNFKDNKYRYLLFLFYAFVLLFIVVLRDIPRISLLSSDPSIHAFISGQIINFGTVFYNHQLYWGDTGFNYPTGLHVTNFIWATLSGLNTIDITSVQVLIQYVLAVLLLMEVLINNVKIDFKNITNYVVIFIMLVFVLFRFMPYSYAPGHYHLEGTGRMASLFWFAILFGKIFSFFSDKKNQIYDFGFEITTMGAVVFVLFAFNPINVIFPMILLPICFAAAAVKKNMRFNIKHALVCVPLIIIVFCIEPVIFNKIFNVAPVNEISNHKFTVVVLLQEYGQALIATVTHLNCKNIFISIFGVAFASIFGINNGFHSASIYLMVLVFAALCAIALKNKKLNIFLIVFPFAIYLIRYLVLIFGYIVEKHQLVSRYYLVNGYFDYTFIQMVHIWFLLVLIALLMSVVKQKWLYFFILLIVASNIIFPYNLPPFDYRKNYPGVTVSAGDMRVISYIIDRFREYSKNKTLTSCNVDKILLPAVYLENYNGKENWLFLCDADNYLALSKSYPVAFYYSCNDEVFTGSKKNNFYTYKEKIKDNFDFEWIKANNIKYLFISESNNKLIMNNSIHDSELSIKGVRKLINESKVLCQYDKSMFLQLY